ncbi:hypothetical protein AVEN_154130-1 [Araneus ventricosus]|uniref:Uncharacterized protein n=1 Tax=Araneus ventricosus TaxID=182803 RepID=A0A4Y2T3F5_ARAVE|nr:hypothetical protein AVEN_55738-1 [Araneus ventricosus]GBN95148.1 hypothetical protein AVEN_154130-1 [Araneus ventricosus]
MKQKSDDIFRNAFLQKKLLQQEKSRRMKSSIRCGRCKYLVITGSVQPLLNMKCPVNDGIKLCILRQESETIECKMVFAKSYRMSLKNDIVTIMELLVMRTKYYENGES